MAILQSVIRYICHNYPPSQELLEARLTKMIYLVDWEYTRSYGTQLTNIQWVFNNYGPDTDDIFQEAETDPLIKILNPSTLYSILKNQIIYIGDKGGYSLPKKKITVINSVINEVKHKFWNSFIRYVYNTFPIKNNPCYAPLNLIEIADIEKTYYQNQLT